MRAGALGRSLVMLLVLGLSPQSIVDARQMPDPRQMSGVPLPVADLPAGTVTVRVIRGSLANPVASQTVELVGAGSPSRGVTNDSGRAEFTGLAPGTRVRAVATVGGERVESQEFAVPPRGGIRLMLVAADRSDTSATSSDPAGSPAAPAQPGSVVLGDESRFVFEVGEDGLSVFYILQIQNATAALVQPEKPIVFELPANAGRATLLEGSSPQAAVSGRELKVAGPFAPGRTLVQLAFTVPMRASNLEIEQKLPLTLMHVAVVTQKVGDMRFNSPQIAEQRDMPAQGNLYIAGRGGAVQAGEVLRFSFSGLPHHSTWPRNLALVLAALVLAGGVWSSLRGGSAAPLDARRQELETARDRLFEELTALELRHREHQIDPDHYAERRRELIIALERVYTALDDSVAVGRAS
jgi:hypothetical protein